MDTSFFSRCVFGLIALLLLNVSIDIPASSLAELEEEHAFNKQESIVELLVEKVLDVEDAFEESNDGDEDESTKKMPHITELFLSEYTIDYSLIHLSELQRKIHYNSRPFLMPCPECYTPPPEC